MLAIPRLDNPPHKIRIVWVDNQVAAHTYHDVDHVRYNSMTWSIVFMDGRITHARFDLVRCIEAIEPTCAEAHQKEVNAEMKEILKDV